MHKLLQGVLGERNSQASTRVARKRLAGGPGSVTLVRARSAPQLTLYFSATLLFTLPCRGTFLTVFFFSSLHGMRRIRPQLSFWILNDCSFGNHFLFSGNRSCSPTPNLEDQLVFCRGFPYLRWLLCVGFSNKTLLNSWISVEWMWTQSPTISHKFTA